MQWLPTARAAALLCLAWPATVGADTFVKKAGEDWIVIASSAQPKADVATLVDAVGSGRAMCWLLGFCSASRADRPRVDPRPKGHLRAVSAHRFADHLRSTRGLTEPFTVPVERYATSADAVHSVRLTARAPDVFAALEVRWRVIAVTETTAAIVVHARFRPASDDPKAAEALAASLLPAVDAAVRWTGSR